VAIQMMKVATGNTMYLYNLIDTDYDVQKINKTSKELRACMDNNQKLTM